MKSLKIIAGKFNFGTNCHQGVIDRLLNGVLSANGNIETRLLYSATYWFWLESCY